MAERPIIFSGEMVTALLAGRKTQTRRVIKPKLRNTHLEWRSDRLVEIQNSKEGIAFSRRNVSSCIAVEPRYKPGDILWVRESWRLTDFEHVDNDWNASVQYKDLTLGPRLHGLTDNERTGWRKSIYMPRAAARIFLRITDVRAERLQDVSEADIIAEGCPDEYSRGRGWFRLLWDSINTGRGYGWNKNPFVWVIAFEQIDKTYGGKIHG